jgi:hypothetical protein
VSHVWLGDFSALYLELGALNPSRRRRRDGSKGHPRGEITIYAGFSWRIERGSSIVAGSSSAPSRRLASLKRLRGAKVTAAKYVSRLPELQLRFSNGLWLLTGSTFEGQPQWSISINARRITSIDVVRGKLHVTQRGS